MQDKNTKYDSMAMTHFKLPIYKKKKKDLKDKNEIHPTNEQIFASFFFFFSNTRFYIYIFFFFFDKLDFDIVAKY